MLKITWSCLLLALFLGFSGCGGGKPSGPKTYAAQGTVTLNGKPLPEVTVTAYPTQGPIATGRTDANGVFTLSTAGSLGATEGIHSVAVTWQSSQPVAMPGVGDGGKEVPNPVPSKFRDPKTSDVKIEVKREGSKGLKIELTE